MDGVRDLVGIYVCWAMRWWVFYINISLFPSQDGGYAISISVPKRYASPSGTAHEMSHPTNYVALVLLTYVRHEL